MVGPAGLRYFRRAKDLVGAGDFTGALAQLDLAIRSAPSDLAFSAWRIYVRFRLGQLSSRQAVELLGGAGARGGTAGAQALHLLGRIYLSEQSSAAAQDCYWLAHEHHPNRTDSSLAASALALAVWSWDQPEDDSDEQLSEAA